MEEQQVTTDIRRIPSQHALYVESRLDTPSCHQVCRLGHLASHFYQRGYGATVARLTPDQKVGSSNLSALMHTLIGGILRVFATR